MLGQLIKDEISVENEIHSFFFLYLCCHLSQVLRQKQVDSPEVKQVSVRRFSTFDLFTRRLVTQDTTADDQWVEYRSVFSPECCAFLMYAHTTHAS